MSELSPMPNQPSVYELRQTLDVPIGGKVVVIDTETTGLDRESDEVLSLAIVDLDGNELFYSLIRPEERRRWPKAKEIHGISWTDVKDKPTIQEIYDDVMDILEGADCIIGYNVEFDIDMLENSGLPISRFNRYDLMRHYAQCYGRWSERKEDYLYTKLEKVAGKYHYEYEAHDALNDAKATAYCFGRFREACESELQIAEQREKDKGIDSVAEKEEEFARTERERQKLIAEIDRILENQKAWEEEMEREHAKNEEIKRKIAEQEQSGRKKEESKPANIPKPVVVLIVLVIVFFALYLILSPLGSFGLWILGLIATVTIVCILTIIWNKL